MVHRVVTVGELTLDDIVVEGAGCDWQQPGGGALYSAIGALAWGARPAICATIGSDYPDRWLDRLQAAGVDITPVSRTPERSLGLWLLYEREGRRHQVEKASGSTFAALDAARCSWRSSVPDVVGVHVAPQTTAGQMSALEDVRAAGVVATQDLLIEPFIDAEPYRSGAAMRGARAFLPSQQEVGQLWMDIDPHALRGHLRESAGIEHLVIKRGAAGADVVLDDVVVRVPPAAETVVDPTGAGDAFCGGFLVGLIDTGDPVEAAVRGAVSAAVVVETRGALAAIEHAACTSMADRARRIRPLVSRG
jgi:ribokinase